MEKSDFSFASCHAISERALTEAYSLQSSAGTDVRRPYSRFACFACASVISSKPPTQSSESAASATDSSDIRRFFSPSIYFSISVR